MRGCSGIIGEALVANALRMRGMKALATAGAFAFLVLRQLFWVHQFRYRKRLPERRAVFSVALCPLACLCFYSTEPWCIFRYVAEELEKRPSSDDCRWFFVTVQ